jgi:uncharacterized protein
MAVYYLAKAIVRKPQMADTSSRLSDQEQETLSAYRDLLLEQIPARLRRLIVYGSRARGDAAPDSDLDIAVILSGHDELRTDGRRPAPFSDPVWQAIVNAACDVSLSQGIYISPVVLTEDRLMEGSSLIRSIRAEGIEVWRRN